MDREGLDFWQAIQNLSGALLITVAVTYLALAGAPAFPQEEKDTPIPAAVITTAEGLFGNISLSSGDLSLSRAYVLLNNEQVADFGSGQVTLRVYPGDILYIDGRAYSRQTDFYIQALSSSIDEAYLRREISCYGSLAKVGTIVFR